MRSVPLSYADVRSVIQQRVPVRVIRVNAPTVLYRLSRILCEQTAGLLLQARCWGRRNVPGKGPVIFASNHQSYFDPILAGCFTTRVLNFMARETLFRSPPFAALIRFYNAFPVKRGGADVAAFKNSLRLLKKGQAILLFPEATRTADGRVRSVQPGAIGLARKANAPILPVAIEGAYDIWPRESRFPRLAHVWVEYGPLLDPVAFEEQSDAQAAVLLTGIMRELHNGVRARAGRQPFEYAAPEAGVPGKAHAPVV